MSDFLIAYKITSDHEGGYVDDPTDSGGETYRGISRKYNPDWKGWGFIDILKKITNAFPANAYSSEDLDQMVKDFYKSKYWDANNLDHFESQVIANEVFDTGVNMGVVRAAKFLQKALNLLNNNGKLYPDIPEDGVVGKGTLNALKVCFNRGKEDFLYKVLNLLQGNHYIEYMIKDPAQEKYAYGWLSRVSFLKN